MTSLAPSSEAIDLRRSAAADHDEAPSRSSSGVVVCIPTFRRPRQLMRLLEALGRQRGTAAFEIVVGNNDDRPLSTYPELSGDGLPVYRVIQVETRGVSAVRNALVANALTCSPHLRFIACLDDDQYPEEEWLAELVRAATLHKADLVGGPVMRSVANENFWSHGAVDMSFLPTDSGPTSTLNEAGNLLLAASFIRALDRPPFSLEFGRSGGEDYEFFMHARSIGARIVWAPAARVHEPLPEERLTFRSYVWRFYSTAAYQARADRSYRGFNYVLRSIFVAGVKAPVVVLLSLSRDHSLPRALANVVRYGAIVAGRIAGLAGKRADRY